ncbi:MAG TPA: exodeoxyribonuclease VII large subunit [Desulfobulbus sp.]|nr:exodeoxyribonuclease VII large subunit [Desulfobulbus sp.]
MNSQHIFTVSELNTSIRSLLEQRFSWLSVSGEISNLRRPYSGHLYFTLKDDRAQLKAVLFKMQQRYLEEQPADGLEVICHGRLSVYEPRGDYQLIVDTIDFHGSGALRAAFEQLKKKLDSEGLFDASHKKKLPVLPEHITLVTSPKGAAVHDFIRIARRRFPGIRLAVYPVAVQGPEAATEICKALDLLNTISTTDIIVLCRGGGSIEDLQAFNDEQLARTIFHSDIPIVSGIGHEIDFTIADFVSDLRAPTPSAAAELVVPDRESLTGFVGSLQRRLVRVQQARIDRLSDKLALHGQKIGDLSSLLSELFLRVDQQSMLLVHAMQRRLSRKQQTIDGMLARLELQNPRHRLQAAQARITELESRVTRAIQQILDTRNRKLTQQSLLLEAVGPRNTMARGYAIVRDKRTGKVVTDSSTLKAGDQARIFLDRGSADVTVDRCFSNTLLQTIKKPAGE